jgi:hypothetical protein
MRSLPEVVVLWDKAFFTKNLCWTQNRVCILLFQGAPSSSERRKTRDYTIILLEDASIIMKTISSQPSSWSDKLRVWDAQPNIIDEFAVRTVRISNVSLSPYETMFVCFFNVGFCVGCLDNSF